MAQRKENFYNPLDFEKDVAIGITLPFSKNKGLFSLSYTTEEQSISNLKNLLLTRKGERLFQPEFGSSVYSLMFEQMDADLSTALDEQMREDIGFWLPYIVIDKLTVTPDFDRNYVNISLDFKVTEQGANQQITIFVDSAGTTTIE